MSTQIHPQHVVTRTHPSRMHPSPAHARHRRWGVIATGVVLALSVYALGLAWAANRLESGIQKSIHPLPVAMDEAGARGPE